MEIEKVSSTRYPSFGEFQDFIFYVRLAVRKTVVIANCKDKSECNPDLTRFIQHLPRLEACTAVPSTLGSIQSGLLRLLRFRSQLIIKHGFVKVAATVNCNKVLLGPFRF